MNEYSQSFTRKSIQAGITAISATLLMAAVATTHADEYPDRPIGVMVAYNPGGATDFQARIATLASAKMDADGNPLSIGQPIYVTNKPGAVGVKAGTGLLTKPLPTVI